MKKTEVTKVTSEKLVAAGYKEFPSYGEPGVAQVFQKLVRRDGVLLYSIKVYFWWAPVGPLNSMNIEVKCRLYMPNGNQTGIDVKLYPDKLGWSIKKFEKFLAGNYTTWGCIPDPINN